MPPSSDLAAIETLIHAGRIGEARDTLERLAETGDADGLFALGMWRMGGQFARLDLASARDLFRRSAEAGRPDAVKVHANFLANGVGGPADWAGALARLRPVADMDRQTRVVLELIEAMSLTPDGDPSATPVGQSFSETPHALRFPDLFTADECDYLVRASQPLMAPSVVVDETTGRHVPHPIRTSDTAAYPWMVADPVVTALTRRIAAASGTTLAQGEPLQVLRYRPGQEYRPHHDAIAGEANQRVMTMIVNLTEDYEGGETRFLYSGQTFRGAIGEGLLWRNADAHGLPDTRAEHAGLPVTAGEKLIASRWIRQHDFTPA